MNLNIESLLQIYAESYHLNRVRCTAESLKDLQRKQCDVMNAIEKIKCQCGTKGCD